MNMILRAFGCLFGVAVVVILFLIILTLASGGIPVP